MCNTQAFSFYFNLHYQLKIAQSAKGSFPLTKGGVTEIGILRVTLYLPGSPTLIMCREKGESDLGRYIKRYTLNYV